MDTTLLPAPEWTAPDHSDDATRTEAQAVRKAYDAQQAAQRQGGAR